MIVKPEFTIQNPAQTLIQVRIVSEQGYEMGRPSRICAEADVTDGIAASIRVGGQCVLVGSGNIHLN